MTDKDKIVDYLNAAIERRVFPGCAAGWIAGGEETTVTLGRHTYSGDGVDDPTPVTEKSLFDCASITKAVPVSCLALRLIDEGKMGLDDRLIGYVPEYRGSFRGDIRVKHLLTHTLDFDFRLSECKDLPPERLLDRVLGAKMKSRPGEKFCYANATSILLGMALEAVCGKALHILAKDVFFEPLGMNDTTFFPGDDAIAGCVPTELDPWRGRPIRGEVHDESAWALRGIMTAGSAGVFSTLRDMLKFVRMLLDGGERFFSRETMEAMRTNQIPHISGRSAGLGWELNQEYMGESRTESTFGKTGFTGCSLIIDTARETGIVLLSNHTWPTRKPNREQINEVRARVADLVLGARFPQKIYKKI
jgi:CubicO group peptidase (beta-lactamase class C family)